jgi:hypothetical protein
VKPGTTCQLLPFTVIFEYGVPRNGCVPVRSWAQQWVALSSLALGSPAYEAALQALTDQVILRNAAPSKPNGSALNQLRTNEIALAAPWELRQFNLLNPLDFLHEQPAFNTPHIAFNNSPTLDQFIMTTPVGTPVPASFLASPFLAASAPVSSPALFWGMNAPNAAFNTRRQDVSVNTCNGCHAGETHTTFTHISPTTPIGSPAALSGFLTGISVVDPQFGTPTRTFNDLARRQSDLVGVAHSVCLAFPPLIPDLVAKAFDGGPLPEELVALPVPSIDKQGTFEFEDFNKTAILTD